MPSPIQMVKFPHIFIKGGGKAVSLEPTKEELEEHEQNEIAFQKPYICKNCNEEVYRVERQGANGLKFFSWLHSFKSDKICMKADPNLGNLQTLTVSYYDKKMLENLKKNTPFGKFGK